MLPLSKVDEEKAKTTPCMFVDTGAPLLLTELFKMGVQKSRAIIKVAGGANVLDTQDLFKIGERNYTILRKILWKNNMLISAENVGGNVSRTIKLEIATGRFWLRMAGAEKEL
jgi:chemotaxis protein CheD